MASPDDTVLPAETAEQAANLFGVLYARAAGGSIEVRPFAPAHAGEAVRRQASRWRAWVGVDGDHAQRAAGVAGRACGAGLDVYFGVALRRGGGGKGSDVVCVTALWAELDGSVSGKGCGCGSKQVALATVGALAVPPTAVVDSGGGYHCYWVLQEPVTGADLHQVPVWNARVREMVRDAHAATVPGAGHAGDDVGDLARILRVPGTLNRKQPDWPRQVQLVALDADCTYSLQHLDTVLPALPTDSFTGAAAAASPSDARPEMQADAQRRERLVGQCAVAWANAEGHRHFLPHPMARVLLSGGWPWHDIPAVIGDVAKAAGSPLPDVRRAAAAKELGTAREGRPLVGWPWLRANAPDMAAALDAALRPDTGDLAELAAHTASLHMASPPPAPRPGLAQPATAGAGLPPTPEPPRYAMPTTTDATTPATGTVVAMARSAAPAPAQAPGADAAPDAARAAERIYNLLRDRLDWIGVGRHDARPYGGRKRLEYSGGIIETVALDGKEAMHWCLDVVRSAGLPLTETNRNIALDMLRADARHNTIELQLRYARDRNNGDILVDMGTDSWRRARIKPGYWHVEPGDTPAFIRSACTLALAEPEVLAQPEDLPAGLQRVLGCDAMVAGQLACWMVQAMVPDAPRMGLFVTGPQGSGKSTMARVARRIVDPARPDLVKFTISKRSEVDYQTANVHKAVAACVAYSNVSSMNEGASDLLCGLITGDGHIARALYSDADPILSEGRRLLIMEGIAVLGMGADLQDRLLHLSLPMREGFEPEAELERRMQSSLPLMQGALFAATAAALATLPAIEASHKSLLDRCRMRDAAAMYAAAADVMGLDAGAMLLHLVSSRDEAQGTEAESDIVGQALLRYAAKAVQFSAVGVAYDGPQESLQEQLLALDQKMPDAWPRTPRAFSARLERLVPGLRAKGWVMETYRSTEGSRRLCVRIQRAA